MVNASVFSINVAFYTMSVLLFITLYSLCACETMVTFKYLQGYFLFHITPLIRELEMGFQKIKDKNTVSLIPGIQQNDLGDPQKQLNLL